MIYGAFYLLFGMLFTEFAQVSWKKLKGVPFEPLTYFIAIFIWPFFIAAIVRSCFFKGKSDQKERPKS